MNSTSSLRKRRKVVKWTREEDDKMVGLVEKYGVKKWSLIGSFLPGRNGKQCRERWHNQLDPAIKKTPWSDEEERILEEAHRKIGNRWAEIAKYLRGRTDNQIKNHWNSKKRKQTRQTRGDESPSSSHRMSTHDDTSPFNGTESAAESFSSDESVVSDDEEASGAMSISGTPNRVAAEHKDVEHLRSQSQSELVSPSSVANLLLRARDAPKPGSYTSVPSYFATSEASVPQKIVKPIMPKPAPHSSPGAALAMPKRKRSVSILLEAAAFV